MSKALIEILIPTYNRGQILIKNLRHLEKDMHRYRVADYFAVTISDNCSTDDTETLVKQYAGSAKIEINYYKSPSNIGLEKNMVRITELAVLPYLLYLGDDDFLAEGYLKFCLDTISTAPECGLIISGLASLLADGRRIPGRNESFETTKLRPSFQTACRYSHMGHQLSGLLFKGKAFLPFYLANDKYRNLYPFVNWVTYYLLKFPAVYAPKYKTEITVGNNKDWSYNEVGLLDEVYKSYYPFLKTLGEKKVTDLMLRFTIMHAYRINFNKSLLTNYREIAAAAKKIKGFRRGLLFFLAKEYTKRKFTPAAGQTIGVKL